MSIHGRLANHPTLSICIVLYVIWSAFAASFVLLLAEGMGSGLGLFFLAPAVPFYMIFRIVIPYNVLVALLFAALIASFLSPRLIKLRDPMIIAVSIYWAFSYVLFVSTMGMHR